MDNGGVIPVLIHGTGDSGMESDVDHPRRMGHNSNGVVSIDYSNVGSPTLSHREPANTSVVEVAANGWSQGSTLTTELYGVAATVVVGSDEALILKEGGEVQVDFTPCTSCHGACGQGGWAVGKGCAAGGHTLPANHSRAA